MLGAAGPVLGVAIVVVRDCRSRGRKSRWIRELCGRRSRRRVVFRGRDVGWTGIRCLRLGILARASAGYISGMPVERSC